MQLLATADPGCTPVPPPTTVYTAPEPELQGVLPNPMVKMLLLAHLQAIDELIHLKRCRRARACP
jgi:hypothetical protein